MPASPEKSDPNSTPMAFALSGLDFCIYFRLLHRMKQLSDLDSRHVLATQEAPDQSQIDEFLHECRICMAEAQVTVLPCLHGVCSTCEQKWVEKHMDCPFCRAQYRNEKRRKREQWQVRTVHCLFCREETRIQLTFVVLSVLQLESFQQDDVDKDIVDLERQLQCFWEERASKAMRPKEMEDFARLERSFNTTVVDDDYVLLF